MLPSTLLILTASATCNGTTTEAVTYLAIRSPLQSSIHNPLRLTNGFDANAAGLIVTARVGARTIVGTLLRDGRVLSNNVIYTPTGW